MTDVVNDATGQIERVGAAARQTLSEAAGQASQTLREAAEGHRATGANAIEAVAKALHIAAREFGETSPMIGRYVDDAAGSLVRASQAVREQSASELLHRTTELARQQPLMTFAGAVLVGMAMSRFIKAGASRPSTAQAGANESATATSYGRSGGDGDAYGSARDSSDTSRSPRAGGDQRAATSGTA